jgi:hypothetical protein
MFGMGSKLADLCFQSPAYTKREAADKRARAAAAAALVSN